MFNPGEYAYDKLNNERVQILDVSEIWVFVSYKVFRPSDSEVYKLSADSLATAPNDKDLDVNYIRYIALLSKVYVCHRPPYRSGRAYWD